MEPLAEWLDREYRYAATAMLASVSATALVKSRPGFGQTLRPKRGSIVASPVLADWDPEPDYFFHWYRDSAVVVDAMRLLYEDRSLGREALAHFADFVRFSLSLDSLNGGDLALSAGWRDKVVPEFRQYVREQEELTAVHGPAVLADTRVSPDGTLDISKWSRPQHDGAPLRALALLRWVRGAPSRASMSDDVLADAAKLIRSDLAFTVAHWRVPSFDIWEEEIGHHYYTLLVTAAALSEGADWLEDEGAPEDAVALRAEVEAVHHSLDKFWSADEGFYRARILASGERSKKELDISVILAPIHALGSAEAHTVRDPRMHATLQRLEALFASAYPINHDRPPERGVAMGRYAGDVYFSGGAYYFSTLGAAEFCFRAAAELRHAPGAVPPDAPIDAQAWIRRGDGFLATVRAFTPASGELSEQFDQRTGEQTSARHLAWSYAAFISCVNARRAVVGPQR
jgi:glucoamylase